MDDKTTRKHRRLALKRVAAGAAGLFAAGLAGAQTGGAGGSVSDYERLAPPLSRPLPDGSGSLPIIGMGTWITFNVGIDPDAVAQRTDVLRTFFAMGGGMIDSSPMYGSAEDVVGQCLSALDYPAGLFAATKVWSSNVDTGVAQMRDSHALWGIDRFDLMQVHNLVGWQQYLPMLAERKAKGELRFVGVTTSHGRRHQDLESILATAPVDFVQLSYSAANRQVESRLLPLAAERGLGVIVNRPFQRGWLIKRLQSKPLPGWAADIACTTWAQVLLKLVVSHPAVSCAIPATSRIAHMEQNMMAARGPMPDAGLRARMFRDLALLV